MQHKEIKSLNLTDYIELLALKGQFEMAQHYLLQIPLSRRSFVNVALNEMSMLWPLSRGDLLDRWTDYKEETDFRKQLAFFKVLIAKQEVDKAVELMLELNDKDSLIVQLISVICLGAKSYSFDKLKHFAEQIKDLDQKANAWESIIADYLLPKGYLQTIEKVLDLLPKTIQWQIYRQRTIEGLNWKKCT